MHKEILENPERMNAKGEKRKKNITKEKDQRQEKLPYCRRHETISAQCNKN